MDASRLLPAERVFRGWMVISTIMYAAAIPLFFAAGAWIVPIINAISARVGALPLYPLPRGGMEGAFWQVLGVSMMVMLTWACWTIQKDVRGRGFITPIILLSKACSTLLYSSLFATDHCLAYLVGALTDGPILLVTWFLWYAARPGERLIDRREEDIILAVGDALMPPGGAFQEGFMDMWRQCRKDIHHSLATLPPMPLLGTRLLVRALNVAPVPALLGLTTLLNAPRERRTALLARLESHRGWLFRVMVVAVKTLTMVAFFNQSAVAAAAGYDPDARIRP